jgi:hypothetical protein
MIIDCKGIDQYHFLFYRQDEEEKKPKPAAATGNKMTAPVFSGKPKDVVCFV